MREHQGHRTRPHTRLPLISRAWMRPQDYHNRTLIRPLRGVIDVHGFFNMLSIGVCTTRHWQMSGRLVQELNACTVEDSQVQSWPYQAWAGLVQALEFFAVYLIHMRRRRRSQQVSESHRKRCFRHTVTTNLLCNKVKYIDFTMWTRCPELQRPISLGPTLMAMWSMVLPRTASCLSSLLGFKSHQGHARKLPVT